ncbi:MAG TPA: pyridoxal kinase PdxY [Stellaceae bacterium]|jgi:pyridoxine kinase
MPTVLSVQSRVAYGHVGNAAANFPLQRLGCEVWSLDTVVFSNHTGHGKWTGAVVPADTVGTLFEGIAELGVLRDCDAVLSGYLGAAETGCVLLDIVARVKGANPAAVFCCDPVIGDTDTGSYVRPGIAEFFRDIAVPRADILTPNLFELDFLTGRKIADLAETLVAAEELRRRGPATVMVTSLATAEDRIAMLAVGDDGAFIVETPRLPAEMNGCGDVTAALFLAHLLRGQALPDALSATASTMYALIEGTVNRGRYELALIEMQSELVSPSRRFEAVKM